MSCCDIDHHHRQPVNHVWPPIDFESLWYIKHHVIKVCTKLEQNQAIPGRIIDNFANFCARYVMLWPWPLSYWPWTFTALRVSCVYKIWVKLNNSWLKYRQFSTYSLFNFRGWGTTDRGFSGLREANFTKLGEDIGRSSQHCTFVSMFVSLAAFSNAGGSKLSDVENDTKFHTFWLPVKITGVVGKISRSIVEALPTAESL